MSRRLIATLVAALVGGPVTPALAQHHSHGGGPAQGQGGQHGAPPQGQGGFRGGGPAPGGGGFHGGSAQGAGGFRGGGPERTFGRAPGYGGRGELSRPSYRWRGQRYARPGWGPGRVDLYRRRYTRYPGYRSYGTYYGLVPPLAAFSGLAFLSAGQLAASYYDQGRTIYVYIVNQGGRNVEYRVDDAGNILSQQFID